MLLETPQFLFGFLPLALAGYYLILLRGKTNQGAAMWLLVCSVIFYAFSRLSSLAILLPSVAVNYGLSNLILSRKGLKSAKTILVLGCIGNLALLSYFKYFGFLSATVGSFIGFNWTVSSLAIPLGISFFTFQQIGYLVDSYRGDAAETTFFRYCSWVTFFPKVIAGPILRSDELLPQLGALRVRPIEISTGISFLVLGLAKKFMLADRLAPISSFVFGTAAAGTKPDLLLAWAGVGAYTARIYFDFSGYCDLAIGLGLLFGIKLPVNFNSPYKALSIIDFWRRWHITLTRFLTEYLYFALPGTRRSAPMRYVNTMITMLLCGLWHGAGWTFVIWGGLHGALLLVNHLWRAVRRWMTWNAPFNRWWSLLPARLLTLVCVMVAWVFFAVPTIREARPVLAALTGSNGLSLPHALLPLARGSATLLASRGVEFSGLFKGSLVAGQSGYWVLLFIAIAMGVATFGPNTQEWLGLQKKAHVVAPRWFDWSPSLRFGVVIGVLVFVLIKGFLQLPPSPFVYGGF